MAAVASGAVVGFSLGVIGGGGSILAVPLLLFAVGIEDPHVAIGTSALAVSAIAFVNLIGHWRAGTVHWPTAILFGAVGAFGAAIGSGAGKLVDGRILLAVFAVVMIVAGVAMLRPRPAGGSKICVMDRSCAFRLTTFGAGTGFAAGFFGIGGGFLVVPGIVLATGMPIVNAIGSSLFAVALFALTTAVNYAMSGFVAFGIAGKFLAGGGIGGFFGIKTAVKLAPHKRALAGVFCAVVFTVAAYMLANSARYMLLG